MIKWFFQKPLNEKPKLPLNETVHYVSENSNNIIEFLKH